MNPFENFYYYEPYHLQDYLDYAKQNPDFSPSDVVWQVNAKIHHPFYQQIEKISDYTLFPLIVNKYYQLPETFIPASLKKFPNSEYQATSETVASFLKLQKVAKEADCHLSVLSAYRSYAYQQDLYQEYCIEDGRELADTYSARPGHSEHQTGYALDVCVTNEEMETFEGTNESNWLIEHAHEYGFIIRYPQGLTHLTGYQYEPWHITYVGIEVANLMKEHQIQTLEEYKVKFMDHKRRM